MSKWIGGLLGAIAIAGMAGSSASQSPNQPGIRSATDIIFARRMLMNGIAQNNDVLHEAMDGVLVWSPQEVQGRLNSISVMLLAFPHLYRPDTDIWSPELEASNPAQVSLSLSAVWANWDDFVRRSEEASKTALDASMAGSDAETRSLILELETQCESCHTAYRHDRPAREFPK